MAKVLLLTQVLPYPLDSGAKIRAYYVLKHLSARHEVTLVSFQRADDRPEWVAHLQEICSGVYTVPMRRSRWRDARAALVSAVTRRPLVIARDEIGPMFALLRGLIERDRFDVIHADQTSMAQYALYTRNWARRLWQVGGPALVLDAHNALFRIPERLAHHAHSPILRSLYQREALALARYERAAYREFDQVVFVAREDKAALGVDRACTQKSERSTGTRLIPICVDTRDEHVVRSVERPSAITHLGTMFWPPNVEGVLWFAREVMPRVLAQAPEAELVIIGKNPPREVQALARGSPSVRVTGYVSDPTPLLAQTAAFIVPLRAAGGMRVKILDAWCWGLPVVSTTIGAEGIDVTDGYDILIADDAEAFAAAVARLLLDGELAQRLRTNGRRTVEERYDWRKVYADWDAVYEAVVGSERMCSCASPG